MREFELLRAGFFRREDRAWEKIATLGLWVLAPYSKKKLTPAQLLGRHQLQTLPTRPAALPEATEQELEIERARALAAALAWAQSDK